LRLRGEKLISDWLERRHSATSCYLAGRNHMDWWRT
jgi:hypothetical protein